MKKLRILFFGGTFVNLDISKKCEKLGAKCWLLDRSIDCMAKNNSNFVNIDFNKKKDVIKFIKKKKINFLYTSQSDSGIKTLGYLNSMLNLNGLDYKTADILTDKIKIRKILSRKGFLQPIYFISKKHFEIKKKIKNKKYMLKPVDSSGSRGVFVVSRNSNIKNIVNKSLSFSTKKKIIVEEKINGKEFGAQTFSINGFCKYVILHDDFMSKINSKIPIGHAMPFSTIKKKEDELKIKLEIKKAINILGVQNGPCNVDCIYTKSKKLFILEVSPRLGATCLPQMLKIYTGVDWDINTINLYNSLKIKKIVEKKINVVAKVFESSKSGIVKKIITGKYFQNAKIKMLVDKNQKIEKFTNGTKLFGYIVAYSKNRKYLIKRVNSTIKNIKIVFKK